MSEISKALSKNKIDKLSKSENFRIVFEPGRVIVGDAGLLVSKVIRTKSSGDACFAILDAGMSDLIRPSLYSAHHDIFSVKKANTKKVTLDVVGPICETADCFATGLEMSKPKKGEYLVIADSGAYGISMASNYNVRKRPKEIVFTKRKKVKVI